MSKPITKSLIQYAKLHMALLGLLGLLLTGFDITCLEEIPVTRLAVIVYVGILMMVAAINSSRDPATVQKNIEEAERLMYFDLRAKYGKSPTAASVEADIKLLAEKENKDG